MPVFEYVAIDAAGKTRKGITDADSLSGARTRLRSEGLYPSRLRETEAGAGAARPAAGKGRATRRDRSLVSPEAMRKYRALFERVSVSELAAATRQMATLLGAGLPLDNTLSVVLQQTGERSRLYRVVAQVRERVKEGASLAQAMEEHPGVFPSTYTTMVRAGESSGTIELVMDRLADFSEQQAELRRKVQATLAYPVLMLVVGVSVVFFLMTYVIPRVTQIFVSLQQALPLPTVVLIEISKFFQQWWAVLPVLLLAGWLGLRWYTRTRAGRRHWHRLLLASPVLGTILHSIAMARFSRTLGTLTKNGVPLMQALAIVQNASENVVVREAVETLTQDVSEGEGLTTPMSRIDIFPPAVVQMVSAGEQSGSLDDMLLRIADMSERDVSTRLAVLTSLLEPVMILVLGGVVGFVVLAVLLPIFEMSSLVQ